MYSDQPTIPSSVVILRNELTRQPASQCRSSTLTIFIGDLLEKTFHVTRCPALRPGCPPSFRGIADDGCRFVPVSNRKTSSITGRLDQRRRTRCHNHARDPASGALL